MFDNRHGSANRDKTLLNCIRSTGVGVLACPVVEQAQIQSEQQQQEQQQEYAAQLSWEASKR